MAATRLTAQTKAKPWGRLDLQPWSAAAPSEPVGEMVYAAPSGDDAELLIKVLFTAERLSVQVHPGGVAARAAGYRRGKDEAWLILAAEPGASIGLGLRERIEAQALAAAARDGSITTLLEWRPCFAGDVFFAPAGTIHAIGAGITLVEVQQNVDLTYRLFDYGRPRPLHLSDGVAVANAGPWTWQQAARRLGEGRTVLVEGPSFVVERVVASGPTWLDPPSGCTAWLALLDGQGRIDGTPCRSGEIWLADTAAEIELDGDATLLLAYAGAGIAPGIWAGARRQAA